ncbi:MAG: RHS repeat-associated core domain-containing protein, partial [Phycisphaerae bacterium]|nr:RHS repeat-associated core domain-containing protein [Phycisphaerae bacterium]
EALEEGDLVALSEVWTDYDGDSSYGDFELDGNPPEPSDLRSYEPGLAMKDPWDESSGIEYYHADLIGTTRGTTDDLGAPAIGASGSPVTYTAFGERVDGGAFQRHSYAGAWGYQAGDFPSGNPAAFLHVGMRWYDPAIGRFLQRDPIGIQGGLNAYAYVDSRPTIDVDPLGLYGLDDLIIDITGGPSYDPWWPWLADFFDDKTRVDHASNFFAGVGLGFSCVYFFPVTAPYAAAGAIGWGSFRALGGSTGNSAIDPLLDGGAIGIGLGTFPKIPRTPRGGLLRPPLGEPIPQPGI